MDYDHVIFVDSSAFKAYIDAKDTFHSHSVAILQKLKEEETLLITSNYILDETFTLIRVTGGLEKLLQFKKTLTEDYSDLKIFRVTAMDEAGAWAWMEQDWSKLSFTDCTSFSLMKRLGISYALSFDRHFERAGFLIPEAV